MLLPRVSFYSAVPGRSGAGHFLRPILLCVIALAVPIRGSGISRRFARHILPAQNCQGTLASRKMMQAGPIPTSIPFLPRYDIIVVLATTFLLLLQFGVLNLSSFKCWTKKSLFCFIVTRNSLKRSGGVVRLVLPTMCLSKHIYVCSPPPKLHLQIPLVKLRQNHKKVLKTGGPSRIR